MILSRRDHSALTSSSHLGIEKLRYKTPRIPEEQRYCGYCIPSGIDNHIEGYVDNEQHFLVSCSTFSLKRNCLFGRLESITPGFVSLTPAQQTATLLCPTKVVTAKLANKYIQILFNIRKLLDEGSQPSILDMKVVLLSIMSFTTVMMTT